MAEKIGLINFTAFDLLHPAEHIAFKRHTRVAQPLGKTLSLAESHPSQPPFPPYAPQLDGLPNPTVRKLAHELGPLMAAFHEHVRDVAIRRDIFRRWQARITQSDLADVRYMRQVDLFHSWMTELLFQRVYERIGRMEDMFRRIHARNAEQARIFTEQHRNKRLEEAELFPRIYLKALRNPFFEEIKEPNQFKALDFEKMRIAYNQRIRREADEQLLELRRAFAEDLIVKGYEKKLEDIRLFKTKGRGNIRKQKLKIADEYDKVWRDTATRFANFREVVREGVLSQAEHYPKMFRKALIDVYEPAIKWPNDHDHFEKNQADIDARRAFEREKAEQKRLASRSYMALRVDDALEHIEHYAARNHRRDRQTGFENNRLINKAQAAAQGMVFLGGQETPRVQVALATDLKATRPLRLGLQGSPRAPAVNIPVPPNLDAYFGDTAGVRTLEGKLHEKLPEAAESEAKRSDLDRRLQQVYGAKSYAAAQIKQAITIDPTENYNLQITKKIKGEKP